ncbi:MAG: hypothetical protein V1746_03540 [bacterium]
MNSWLLNVGLCLGLVLMAFALFHSNNAWLRRAGGMLLIGTSGLALWFWTQNWIVVALGISAWFALPVGQAVWMARRLRLPAKRKLEAGNIDEEEFSEITEFACQLRKLDFRWEGDYWLKPSPARQAYRLFTHAKEPVHAAVAVVQYGMAGLMYTIFATQEQNGTVWLTWDYPLAYGLMMPPNVMTHRCLEAASVEQLYEQHRQFISLNAVKAQPTTLPVAFFEQLFSSTIDYNLRAGLLRFSESNEINYTWRGTAFVSWQVLRDVVGV